MEQVLLVTGGSRGTGAPSALPAAANGHAEADNCVGREDAASEVVQRIAAAGGIRVDAVRPGLTDTGIHASGGLRDRLRNPAHQVPMGGAGTADEVAQAIVRLLSPPASYTTMSMLEVSGGR